MVRTARTETDHLSVGYSIQTSNSILCLPGEREGGTGPAILTENPHKEMSVEWQSLIYDIIDAMPGREGRKLASQQWLPAV